MCKIFIISIFVLSFSIFAHAQGTTDYRFLEVIDFADKPVVDATVKVQISCDGGDKKTNEKGIVERFPIGGGDCGQLYDFAISKDGYYPFRDMGLFSSPYNDIYREQFFYDQFRNRENYKIELLKIPQNKAEQKAIGNEQKKRELFWAVRDKNTAEVRKLLKSGINPNLKTRDLRGVWLAPENLSAVTYSAALGDIETVKEFIRAGVKPNQKDSPAHDILLYYLGANPRKPYSYTEPKTEDEKAQLSRFQNGIDFLIDVGADVQAQTKDGKTALMISAFNGDIRTVKLLVDKNLPINQQDKSGMTALAYSTVYNSLSTPNKLEIAELLLKKGANPNTLAFDNDYEGGSDTYCSSPLINAVSNDNPKLVKLLLDNDADMNLACKNGKTAFQSSIRRRWNETREKYEIINIMLGTGAKLNTADKNGVTNLMVAAGEGNADIVERLLKMGASVNAQNKNGETALITAISRSRNIEVIKVLFKYGADPNLIGVRKWTDRNGKVFEQCVSAVIATAETVDNWDAKEIMEILVANKADVNGLCGNGDSPLVIAAKAGLARGLKKLLEVGADAKGEQGTRALKYAKENLNSGWGKPRFEEIIKLLETAGAK